MKVVNSLDKAIKEYISKFGEDSLFELINKKEQEIEGLELTIIANAGIHPLQSCHQRGEIYIASRGNIDFSSHEAAHNEIIKILILVAEKLKSKPWRKVYLVPFGPAVISMCIKSLVYKILNQETVDVLHVGNGVHYDIYFELRNIAAYSAYGGVENNESNSTF